MKGKNKLVGILAVTLLSNAAMPMVYAASGTYSVPNTAIYAQTNEAALNEANSKLDYLGDLIDGIEKIGDLTGQELGWLKELKEAYKAISKIVEGLEKGVGNIAELRAKVIPRIDLLINIAETITADATELSDSQQQAHVIIGFAVTRAVVKAVDPFETADELKKASSDLTAALDRARAVPKQTEDSVRTHYNLEKLNKAINDAKRARNKELRNKLDATMLAEVDMAIKKAEDVKRNNKATVKEVAEAADELNAKIEEAYNSIPEGERIASKSTKVELEKDIKIAKNVRKELKGKVDSSVIKELSKAISSAERVLKNNRSTVNEVQEADKAIVEATNIAREAINVVPEENPAVEPETPVVPEEDPAVEPETPVVPEEDSAAQDETTPVEDNNNEVEQPADEVEEALVEVVE